MELTEQPIHDHGEVDISEFIRAIGLDRAAPKRVSFLLASLLYIEARLNRQNPAKVVQEIAQLESGDTSQLKKPIQNQYPPLKGLWHKHYLQDGIPSMAMNVQKGLDRYGIPLFKQGIREAKAAGEERFVTSEDIPALVHDLVSGNLNRLAASQALTGEWLLFAKHEGQNYYLAICTHDTSTHGQIRKQIDQFCCVEFPFLKKLLE